jgi:hypothetical protein
MENQKMNIFEAADGLQERAKYIIKNAGIIEAWKGIGAEINLVGSARMKLMAKHRDVDFHIYTDPFSIADSFKAIAQIAENSHIKKIMYGNLLDAEDRCLNGMRIISMTWEINGRST